MTMKATRLTLSVPAMTGTRALISCRRTESRTPVLKGGDYPPTDRADDVMAHILHLCSTGRNVQDDAFYRGKPNIALTLI